MNAVIATERMYVEAARRQRTRKPEAIASDVGSIGTEASLRGNPRISGVGTASRSLLPAGGIKRPTSPE